MQRRRILCGLARDNRLGGGSLEGRAAQQSEVGCGSERIDVGALVHPLPQELLGCGELRRAAAGGGASEPGVPAQRERQAKVRDAQPAVRLETHGLYTAGRMLI